MAQVFFPVNWKRLCIGGYSANSISRKQPKNTKKHCFLGQKDRFLLIFCAF